MDNVNYKILEKSLRSSLYITKYGDMQRHYHDTNVWTPVLPRCNDDGNLCSYKNKSLQRLIAEAWLHKPERFTKNGRIPNVKVIDSTKSPYDASNLEWCYGRSCKISSQSVHIPPKLEELKEIIEEYIDSDEEISIEEISNKLETKDATTWNYICKLLSILPDFELFDVCIKLSNKKCLEYCLNNTIDGPLKNVLESANDVIRDNEWNMSEYKYFHLKLCRMYITILE